MTPDDHFSEILSQCGLYASAAKINSNCWKLVLVINLVNRNMEEYFVCGPL